MRVTHRSAAENNVGLLQSTVRLDDDTSMFDNESISWESTKFWKSMTCVPRVSILLHITVDKQPLKVSCSHNTTSKIAGAGPLGGSVSVPGLLMVLD